MADEKFFYANGVECQAGAFDITLKFFRLGARSRVSAPGEPAIVAENKVAEIIDDFAVGMAPGGAMAVVAALVQGIVNFENSTKLKVEVRPELQASIDAAFNAWKARK